jgi:hypothetical protein
MVEFRLPSICNQLRNNPMDKKFKIAIVALAGLVAVGGIAAANKGWKQGGHGGPAGFEQLAERYDTNKDGKISQSEIDANRASWLVEFDADKSGSLALSEFQNLWLKANNQRMVRDFQRLDSDASGQVTAEEYKSPLAKLVAEMDRDKDGAVSMDEIGMGKHGPRDRGAKDKTPDDQ